MVVLCIPYKPLYQRETNSNEIFCFYKTTLWSSAVSQGYVCMFDGVVTSTRLPHTSERLLVTILTAGSDDHYASMFGGCFCICSFPDSCYICCPLLRSYDDRCFTRPSDMFTKWLTIIESAFSWSHLCICRFAGCSFFQCAAIFMSADKIVGPMPVSPAQHSCLYSYWGLLSNQRSDWLMAKEFYRSLSCFRIGLCTSPMFL